MSGKYYYLVASLPYLKFRKVPPVSSVEFLSECEKWLSPEDMEMVKSAGIKDYAATGAERGAAREWKEFDGALRSALAGARHVKRPAGRQASGAAKEILEKETPLAKETAFEEARWRFLEEKSAAYFFDANWLAIYYIKLQILERLAVFNKDKGERMFYDLCEVRL